MPKTDPVVVRVADLPQMEQFIGAVAALIKALAKCDDLPDPVIAARAAASSPAPAPAAAEAVRP